jgi:hypothetical protein
VNTEITNYKFITLLHYVLQSSFHRRFQIGVDAQEILSKARLSNIDADNSLSVTKSILTPDTTMPTLVTAVINNNNNNLLTASGLSPGGSGYFTFKLRQTYYI